MHRWFILLVFFIVSPVFAEDEEPLEARVVDSPTNRVPLLTVAPEYPRKARRDRIEAQVQVCFDVDRGGRTLRIAVRNSTNRAFEKPSIKAVRASTFRPIGKDEALQAIKSCRTFIFSFEPAQE